MGRLAFSFGTKAQLSNYYLKGSYSLLLEPSAVSEL
jgi:hypothetical protein